MATDNAPQDTAYGYLVTVGVAETMKLLAQSYDLAREFVPAVAPDINDVLIGFIREINDVAVQATGYSEGFIIREILDTRAPNRPHQAIMESHILSRPGPFGLVEVAMLDELDKIVNPAGGYGPYWRAQEYGTGSAEVPSQVDRVLLGSFEPSGTRPDANQRGTHVGTDLAFVPGGDKDSGFGTISVDLPARHFLRDGFAEAGLKYKQQMTDVQARWDMRIAAVLSELKAMAGRGGGFTGIIEG